MGKMTDEEVEYCLHVTKENGSPESARQLRAHIDALTADRDAARDAVAACAACAENVTLRERVKTLEEELDHSRKCSGKALTEERAQSAHLRECYESERTARVNAESRLATIRQRAGDLDQQVGYWMNLRLPPETIAEHIRWLLGIGDDTPAPETADRLCRHGEGAYASDVVGDDCENCGEPLCMHRTSEPTTGEAGQSKADPLHPRGKCMCAGEGECEWCRRVASETTTAEAFAMVREVLKWHEANQGRVAPEHFKECGDALSLLERRMGAMARAIRMCLDSTTLIGLADAKEAMRAALADTPAVFMLEEVRQAARDYGFTDAVEGLTEYLAAMRRKG